MSNRPLYIVDSRAVDNHIVLVYDDSRFDIFGPTLALYAQRFASPQAKSCFINYSNAVHKYTKLAWLLLIGEQRK